MTFRPLAAALLLTALAAGTAAAGSRGGVERDHRSGAGDCQVRRVTGPRDAYRYERTECEAAREDWSGYEQWGYGRGRLDVETDEGDRYGERRAADYAQWSQAQAYAYEQQRLCGCVLGYEPGRGGPGASYPPYEPRGYVTAGRDDYGWLVWAGKRP